MIGLGSLGAVHYLARALDPLASSRGAVIAAIPGDPEVTGSIGTAASATTLDPCSLRASQTHRR